MVRISSRGTVTGGIIFWVVMTLLFWSAALLVLAWPLAITEDRGHFTWYGWALEALYVASPALLVRAHRAATRRRAASRPAPASPAPLNERLYTSDRR